MAVIRTPDINLVRAEITTAVLWSARRGGLDQDWRARLRREVITPPATAPAVPSAGPACRRCIPRPEPSPAVAAASAVDALRRTTEDLCVMAAVLEITADDRPVAAWEPAADVGWRAALSAWRVAALASHLAVARHVRRRAWLTMRSTTAAAVWTSTGVDLTADRDIIHLAWRLGLHDGRAVPDDDAWRGWLAARLPHWHDRDRADVFRLAMMDPDQPFWAPATDDGVWAAAGIGGGRLPAAWTHPEQQPGDRAA